jgi:hypothetical protein
MIVITVDQAREIYTEVPSTSVREALRRLGDLRA